MSSARAAAAGTLASDGVGAADRPGGVRSAGAAACRGDPAARAVCVQGRGVATKVRGDGDGGDCAGA